MRKKDLIGKTADFDSLFSLYRERIYRHTFGIVKDEEAAQDLTQETFVQAYRHLNEFRGESQFYTWIYRISHNLALNYLKKKKRHKEEEFHEETYLTTPSNEAETKDLEEALKAVQHALPKKQAQVYQLCEIEKRPQKEVAALLKIPEGTVRSRLHTARKKIRDYFSSSSHNFRND